MKADYTYFVVYKPFGCVSQFSGEDFNLSQLAFSFPTDVYPVGRLDKDSEGLLIITNDKNVHHRMTDPKFGHSRIYWVQVEGSPDKDAVGKLNRGVEISLPNKKKYLTRAAEAEWIAEPDLPQRIPPIRFRKSIPDSWLQLTLTEGKNRQVRKMTAQVGFPTLRLVRVAIENLKMENMDIGDVKEYSQKELYSLLNLS